jgi:hypothetical protein
MEDYGEEYGEEEYSNNLNDDHFDESYGSEAMHHGRFLPQFLKPPVSAPRQPDEADL